MKFWLVSLLFFTLAATGMLVENQLQRQPVSFASQISFQTMHQEIQQYAETTALRLQSDALEAANQDLINLITDWAENEPGEFGVSVLELNGERRAEYNADERFVSASTYKLFFVYAALHQIENSVASLQSETSIGRTVEDCIESLLVYSWDICGWPIAQFVGIERLEVLLHDQGFTSTDLNNYDSDGNFVGDKYSTPADEALFMTKLYKGQLLNAEHTEYFIDLLKTQKWRERIPAGVPEGITVADKPGWLYEYENDAAIVYGKSSTYVLVIMSNNSSEDRLAELSSAIYNFMNS